MYNITRKQAAQVIALYLRKPRESTTVCGGDSKFDSALNLAIDALSANPCDNCVGVGLAVAHGYTDMRIKKPEVEE